MSVNFQTFLLYGVEITEESFDESRRDELYDEFKAKNEGEVTVIYDGRSGQYVYLGVLLKKSNSTRDGPQDIGRFEFDESGIPNNRSQVEKVVEKYDLEVVDGFSFKLFTHVT
jgi:hypothetical protein